MSNASAAVTVEVTPEHRITVLESDHRHFHDCLHRIEANFVESNKSQGVLLTSMAAKIDAIGKPDWKTLVAAAALIAAIGSGMWGLATQPLSNSLSRAVADLEKCETAIGDLAKQLLIMQTQTKNESVKP